MEINLNLRQLALGAAAIGLIVLLAVVGHAVTPVAEGSPLVLTPERTERSLAQITVTPSTANADRLADGALESLRTAIPALRALPLLRKLALGEGGDICLDYLPPMQLNIAIQPC